LRDNLYNSVLRFDLAALRAVEVSPERYAAALGQASAETEDWAGVVAAAEELIALQAADADTWAALANARVNLKDTPGALVGAR
jgi:hypothetical protein